MKYQQREDFKESIKKRNRYNTLGMVVGATMFLVSSVCLMLITKGLQWYVSILLILIYLFLMNKVKKYLKEKETNEKRKIYSIINEEVKPMLEDIITEDYIDTLIEILYLENDEDSNVWVKLDCNMKTHFIKDNEKLGQVRDAIEKTGLGRARYVDVKEEQLETHAVRTVFFIIGDQRNKKLIPYNEVTYV